MKRRAHWRNVRVDENLYWAIRSEAEASTRALIGCDAAGVGPGSGAGGGGSDRKGCGRMSAEAPGRPLTHWTVETGVKRESPRSDVTPALLAALAPDVERIGPDTVHTVFAVPGTVGWLWHARGCRWRASCNRVGGTTLAGSGSNHGRATTMLSGQRARFRRCGPAARQLGDSLALESAGGKVLG